jgi:hypothetical protein
MRRVLRACALALPLALGAAGCQSCGEASGPDKVDAGTPKVEQVLPGERVLHPLIDGLASCDIDHRGKHVDLGSPAASGRFGFVLGEPPGLEDVEHDSSTWSEVFDRTVTTSFVLVEPTPVFVAMRVIGRDARQAHVTLDDQPLGTLSFTRDHIRVAETGVTTLPIDAGEHTVSVRFLGPSRDSHVPFAELDWLRLGFPDEDKDTFGAPTIPDIVTASVALGGVPHRAIALRGRSAVRCGIPIPERATLKLSLGLEGGDEAPVRVLVRRDGVPPVVLHEGLVRGGAGAVWTDLELPLGELAGSLATIELAVPSRLGKGRLLFGEPRVVVTTAPPPRVPKARAAVLVLLGGVTPRELPPWKAAADPSLPTLSSLVLGAAVFDRLRAPTTFASSALASLLTGQRPRAHGFVDLATRLPAGTTTLATIARDAGVHTALFSGVPTTSTIFGFAEGWERYREYLPQSGQPATAPLDDAAAWVTEVTRDAPDGRLLAVVHARGAHPPWDIAPKDLEGMLPLDYAGALEPRRSAQLLARARQRGAAKVLAPEDFERARALAAAALTGQDKAVRGVIEALTAAGLWDQTLFVVMGDVSSGLEPNALYGDGLPLSEPLLSVPLYVHFPGDLFGAARITTPVEVYDIGATALASLGLSFGADPRGRDLAAIASGLPLGVEQPLSATVDDRYAGRLGELLVSGRSGKAPSLCDLALDPTCSFDRRKAMPLATQWLFRAVSAREGSATGARREPVTVDLETDAALRVWGAISD